jgi:hypothetical protein
MIKFVRLIVISWVCGAIQAFDPIKYQNRTLQLAEKHGWVKTCQRIQESKGFWDLPRLRPYDSKKLAERVPHLSEVCSDILRYGSLGHAWVGLCKASNISKLENMDLVVKKFPLDAVRYSFVQAAATGNLEILNYLSLKFDGAVDNQLLMNMFSAAARNDQVDVAKYLHSFKVPFDVLGYSFYLSALHGKEKFLKYMGEFLVEKTGNALNEVPVLKDEHKQMHSAGNMAVYQASKNGNVTILNILRSFRVNMKAMDCIGLQNAVRSKNPQAVRFFVDAGCPVNDQTISTACALGQIESLTILLSNGGDITDSYETCVAGAVVRRDKALFELIWRNFVETNHYQPKRPTEFKEK